MIPLFGDNSLSFMGCPYEVYPDFVIRLHGFTLSFEGRERPPRVVFCRYPQP